VSAHVLRGDARRLPLPDASVDLIVTSPPYWQLRSYQDGGEHYDGQIGDEPTHRAYVEALLDATREWIRVLKPTGSLFVNLGDKYANRSGTGWGREGTTTSRGKAEQVRHATGYSRADTARASGLPEKSLMNLPARYAIAVTDELGLIQRAEVVWSKPNGLPESVTDRVRRSHELWLHFTREPRYFDALDLIREPHQEVSLRRAMPHRSPAGRRGPEVYGGLAGQTLRLDQANHPLGRLPGSVWEVPTEPLIVPAVSPLDGRPLPDHYAAFPTEFPRRIIAAFCPEQVCSACGEGLRPVTGVAERAPNDALSIRTRARTPTATGTHVGSTLGYSAASAQRMIVGYACACNEPIATPTGSRVGDDPSLVTGRGGLNRPRADDEGVRILTRHEQRWYAEQLRDHPLKSTLRADAGPTAFDHYARTDRAGARPIPPDLLALWLRHGWLEPAPPHEPAPTSPGVVLDPFGGTGTVALVADVTGRVGISVDLSHDYGRLARWRVSDPGERARAMLVQKPPKQIDGQADLFAMEG
jgi:DNA modification methylase